MISDKIFAKTLRQEVYDRLKAKIIAAEIPPGQMMTIQGVAKKFGVSIMPVREALWQLESEKVVVIESNRRIYVNALTRAEMEEALRIRLILESMAVERCGERITDGELAKLRHILEALEAAVDKPKRYIYLNSQYHFAIYSFADSPVLLGIIDSLWARVGPYLRIAWEKGGDPSSSLKCHRGMYRALVDHDKDALKKWLCTDLNEAASILTPLLNGSMQSMQTARKNTRR
jgi:DNA-binding GntR family transcriptional regulator